MSEGIDINIFDMFRTPPTVTITTLGENIGGKTILYNTPQAHEEGFLERIFDAVPFGTLLKKVPSVSEAAKGVAIGAVEAGKGVGSAVSSVGTAAASGVKTAVIIVVLCLVGYLLLPSLIAGAARR